MYDFSKLDFYEEIKTTGNENAEKLLNETLLEPAHDFSPEEFEIIIEELGLHNDLPDVEKNLKSPSPFSDKTLIEGLMYRGWYGNVWCPKQSKFGGRGGRHGGVDLAYLSGWDWTNNIYHSRIQWNVKPSDRKWGNHIFENFKWNDGLHYTFVYAHLQSLVGSAPRTINGAWENICKTNCTGNAGGSGMYCGTDNACGRRSDHIHMELFKKQSNGKVIKIDPIAWLEWNLSNANDNRCVSCV